jgi:hypothetical protein
MGLNLEVSYLDSAYTYSGNMPQSICLSFSHSVLKGEVYKNECPENPEL